MPPLCKSMIGGLRLKACCFFFLSVLTGCISAPPAEPPEDGAAYEDLPRPSPVQAEEGSAGGPRRENGESNFPMPDRPPEDPFDELHGLWKAGRLDEARRRFHFPDIRRLSQHARRDEWLLWRGRLFLSHLSAADLGLAGDNISALLVDRDDLWVGTWTGGVSRRSLQLETSHTFDPGLPSADLRTVNRFRRIPFGIAVVRYGAVERYNTRSGLWESWDGLPAAEGLQDILQAGRYTYLGTLGGGLWAAEGSGEWKRVAEPGAFITRLEEASEERILIAAMDWGIFIHNPAADSWLRPPDEWLQSANVTSVTEYNGQIIGGTYGEGAFVWNTRTNDITRFGKERLGDSYVLAVAEVDGRIFFGTFGGGVRVWTPDTEEWDTVSLDDGFLSADTASLAVGAGNIWAGTLKGGVVSINRGIYGNEY